MVSQGDAWRPEAVCAELPRMVREDALHRISGLIKTKPAMEMLVAEVANRVGNRVEISVRITVRGPMDEPKEQPGALWEHVVQYWTWAMSGDALLLSATGDSEQYSEFYEFLISVPLETLDTFNASVFERFRRSVEQDLQGHVMVPKTLIEQVVGVIGHHIRCRHDDYCAIFRELNPANECAHERNQYADERVKALAELMASLNLLLKPQEGQHG